MTLLKSPTHTEFQLSIKTSNSKAFVIETLGPGSLVSNSNVASTCDYSDLGSYRNRQRNRQEHISHTVRESICPQSTVPPGWSPDRTCLLGIA